MALIANHVYLGPKALIYRDEAAEPKKTLLIGNLLNLNSTNSSVVTKRKFYSHDFRLIPFQDNVLPADKVVGFFHMFEMENQNFRRIVAEQIAYIKSSDILSEIDAIKYVYIGQDYLEYSIPDSSPKFIKSNRSAKHGNEDTTLQLLHEHCTENTRDIVFYIHTKGSFHNHELNDKFRQNLMKAVIFCVKSRSVFESSDLCGFRMSPLPYPQLSGQKCIANISIHFRPACLDSLSRTFARRSFPSQIPTSFSDFIFRLFSDCAS